MHTAHKPGGTTRSSTTIWEGCREPPLVSSQGTRQGTRPDDCGSCTMKPWQGGWGGGLTMNHDGIAAGDGSLPSLTMMAAMQLEDGAAATGD